MIRQMRVATSSAEPVRDRALRNLLARDERAPGLLLLLAWLVLLPAGCGHRKLDYSVSSLVKTLKDKDPNMRYWAAESLGHLGAEARPAVPNLIEALKDENKMVRMGAAYAIAEIGSVEAELALTDTLKDPAEEVREAAAYALKQIQEKREENHNTPQRP